MRSHEPYPPRPRFLGLRSGFDNPAAQIAIGAVLGLLAAAGAFVIVRVVQAILAIASKACP